MLKEIESVSLILCFDLHPSAVTLDHIDTFLDPSSNRAHFFSDILSITDDHSVAPLLLLMSSLVVVSRRLHVREALIVLRVLLFLLGEDFRSGEFKTLGLTETLVAQGIQDNLLFFKREKVFQVVASNVGLVCLHGFVRREPL